MFLRPPVSESEILLVVVKQAFYVWHTFTFRLPLMPDHRATNWNNICRCGNLSNFCVPMLGTPTVSSMSMDYLSIDLGTIINSDGAVWRKANNFLLNSAGFSQCGACRAASIIASLRSKCRVLSVVGRA